MGLAPVVEELRGIHLAKAHSAADWSTRPLPQGWLVYAALDVEPLPDLRDRIAELLEEGGKTEIARQEFAAVLERETPVRHEPWRRLSGMHALRSPRQLAIARALWTSRDQLAQELDVAPGRLVPDLSLVAAAKAQPASKRELAALKDFTGRASRRELDRWWAAIETGLADPEPPNMRGTGDGVPAPRLWAEKNPEADRRLKRARAAVTARAEQLGVPLENVLTPDTLRRVQDYLASLDIVDPNRLVVTGLSMGGEITTFMAALDTRPALIIATGKATSEAVDERRFVVASRACLVVLRMLFVLVR